jgi:hypothetical protein
VVRKSEVSPEKDLSPANNCVLVDTRPRAAAPASGILRVISPVEVAIFKSVPAIPVAKFIELLVSPDRFNIPLAGIEIVVVDNTPLIFDNSSPVEVANDKVLFVIILLVAFTPLVLLVNILPSADKVLLEMTEEVAVTPLMVVVRVLPPSD